MTSEALRRIAAAHGLLAWLSAALLALAAGLLARRRSSAPTRSALAVAALATSVLAGAGALGVTLHEPYLNRLRQRIFVRDPALGWLFERKEHLSFGALALALCALAALSALVLEHRRLARSKGSPSPTPAATSLRRAALAAYAASAALALAACVLSSLVGRRFSF